MYTLADCRDALVRALRHEWQQPVKDFDDGQAATPYRIQSYFVDCGWEWFLEEHTPDGLYNEKWRNHPWQSWCGLFVGYGGRRMGDFFNTDQCLDVRLHDRIVEDILPGTDRLYDRGRWLAADLPEPDQPDPQHLKKADVITVGDEVDGSHIATVLEDRQDGEKLVKTIEGNASGLLGDRTHGEGVVRRKRELAEIRQTYRLIDPPYLQGSVPIDPEV